LRFPSPIANVKDAFQAIAEHLGISASEVHHWPRDLSALDPFTSAQVYFYFLRRAPARAYPGLPRGMASLEYWFLYPLNYFPLVRVPLQALVSPIASTIGNTDYHQGDLEHVAVLLDPRTLEDREAEVAGARVGAALRAPPHG